MNEALNYSVQPYYLHIASYSRWCDHDLNGMMHYKVSQYETNPGHSRRSLHLVHYSPVLKRLAVVM